jgi:hypothetical protein
MFNRPIVSMSCVDALFHGGYNASTSDAGAGPGLSSRHQRPSATARAAGGCQHLPLWLAEADLQIWSVAETD